MAKPKMIIMDEFSMYASDAFASVAGMGRSIHVNRLLKDEVSLHSNSLSKLLSIMNADYFAACKTESLRVFYKAISKFDNFTEWEQMIPHFSSSRNKRAWITFVVNEFYEGSITKALESNVHSKYSAEFMALMAI